MTISIIQLIIALGIFNVWLVRVNRATPYRGGDAKTMEEEFHVDGLSTSFMKAVRATKLAAATGLIMGLWYPPLTGISALAMAVLMVGAVIMHARVRDPLKKALPAAVVLCLSLAVFLA